MSETLTLAPYRIRFSLDGTSSHAPAATEAGALAVSKAFQFQNAGNPDAYASVHELDGSNAGIGRKVSDWWGGERFGPKDQAHPMERLMRKAIRSGARVTIIADGDRWEFGDDFAGERIAA
jgi:hypothetical protein